MVTLSLLANSTQRAVLLSSARPIMRSYRRARSVQRITIIPTHPPMLTPTLVAAILQGLSLYGLHLCFEHDLWPSQHPVFFVPVITALILWPIGIAYLEG